MNFWFFFTFINYNKGMLNIREEEGMSWQEDYINKSYVSREVSQLTNEHNDEIELETVQFQDHYHVVATLSRKKPPFIDCLGEGRDQNDEKLLGKQSTDSSLQ